MVDFNLPLHLRFMKKRGLTFIFLLVNMSLYSQSKLETENWIKSKFNKWKITDTRTTYSGVIGGIVTGGSSEKPISLSFINCSLIFKSKFNFYSPPSIGQENNTYSLNIGDIEKVEWIKNKVNYTTYLVVVTKKSLVKKTSVSQNDSEELYVDRCIIAFNTEGEENFEERMLKAFNHLRSLCPTTKKNQEVF
jgi:hypothetical protein